jgi:hypothetical protein
VSLWTSLLTSIILSLSFATNSIFVQICVGTFVFYVDELFLKVLLFLQVLSNKLPEVLDFNTDLAHLEPASKVA